ncbi:MAG: hypothetical protein IJ558_14110 [Treponema sp.]|nr:hypothetical protein [Treponema sp.]MBR1405295.1 hypothetical protein [Treponema sp.]
MKKQLKSFVFLLCSAAFSVLLSSCAETFNEKFPEKSDTLASTLGIVYNSTENKEDGYSYIMTSSIDAYDGYDIWSFSAAAGVTYSVVWKNADDALMSVSVSTSVTDFSSSSYAITKDETASPIRFSSKKTSYVYIKVEPSENISTNTGSYSIQIAGGSDWIRLSKAKTYEGSSSSGSSTITTGSAVPSYAWTTENLYSATEYDIFYFYASSGTTYRVFWDDYSDGGNYYYSSYGADVRVTASTSPDDFDSSNYVFSSCSQADTGYSIGKKISVSSSGYVYLKVYPSSITSHATGSYRIAVTTESSYTSLSYVGPYSNAVSATDVAEWTDGSLSSSSDYKTYRFYATSGNTYTVFWQDYYDKYSTANVTADVSVSASSSSSVYFTSNDSGYSSPHPIVPDSSEYIYLTVNSAGSYSSRSSGSFKIAVISGVTKLEVIPVTITEYADMITAANVTEWTNGSLSLSGEYYIYQFDATAGSSYTVFWDDYYDGSASYKYNSTSADILVSAASSTDFSSEAACHFYEENSGYSTGRVIEAESDGTIYLKVQPNAMFGSFRIGVVNGLLSSSLTSVALSLEERHEPAISSSSLSYWTSDSISTTSDYVIYQFDATADTTYTVFWDDYTDGSSYLSSSYGADILVSAGLSSEFDSTDSQFFTQLDRGYSEGQSFETTSAGTVYLKVEANNRSGSYRIAVVSGTSLVSMASVTVSEVFHFEPGVTVADVTEWTEGSITETSGYALYRFYTNSSYTYTVFLDDYSDGDAYKSASDGADILLTATRNSSDFESSEYCYFTNVDESYSSPIKFTASSYGYVYLMVAAPQRAGNYKIAVVQGELSKSASSVELTEYADTITGSDVETWTSYALPSTDDYAIYRFDVTAGERYTVLWDDYYNGSYYYNSLSADIKVSASPDSSNFTSSSVCYFTSVTNGYSSGQTITPDEGGTVYLKVEVKDSQKGLFRIAVVKGRYVKALTSVPLTLYEESDASVIALTPYSSSATAGSSVPASAWVIGSLSELTTAREFSFAATAGKTYKIFWADSKAQGSNDLYSADVQVSGNSSLDSMRAAAVRITGVFTDVDSGYTTYKSMSRTGSDGTFYLRVEPYSSSANTGTFAIAVLESE